MISKKILSTMIVSLLALSMFAFTPRTSANPGPYTLTFDAAYENVVTAYEQSVKLTPAQENLVSTIIGVYVNTTKQDTLATYTASEGSTETLKVPISANLTYLSNYWGGLFEHWEVWDQDGSPQLAWPNGLLYKAVYTGTFPGGYTRITKVIAIPNNRNTPRAEIASNLEALYMKSQKDLLDRSDGVLEPYLKFTVNNPVGGGNKKVIAVYYLGWGPETEHMYWKTILSPDATRIAFLNNEIDVTLDMIRTIDIDAMAPVSVITSTPGLHMCYLGFNLRENWAGPQTGAEPGLSLRKAVAHLIPKDNLIATLFKYIVIKLDSWLPPSLGEWYEPGVTIYDYDPVAAYNTLIAGGWTFNSGKGTWENVAAGVTAGGADNIITIMSPLYEVAPTSFTVVARITDEMNGLKNPTTGAATPLHAVHAPTDFNTIVDDVFNLHTFEAYFLCWGLTRFPTILYSAYDSANDIVWGDNAWGLHNSTLDQQLEILEFGLVHSDKVTAAKQAQKLLSTILPNIPIYSRNYFNAQQKNIYGTVLEPGVGIENFFAYMEAKGARVSALFVPPLTQIAGNETIWHDGDKVESFNEAQVASVYAARVVDGNMYDGLMGVNPYTLQDEPWLAKAWSTTGPVSMTTPHGANMVNGQYVVFTLDDRVPEGKVLWHDGTVFDASDIIASWTYIWGHQLSRFFTFWENLIDVNSPDASHVVAYWNTTSQFLIYDAAGTAALFEPDIWRDYVSSPAHLNLQTDAQIRAFKPELTARSTIGAYPAQNAYPWLSAAVGTGQYVLHDASTDGYNTNLFCFDLRSHTVVMPNLHYWKTKGEIKESKIEDFYHIGDATIDGSIDISDLAKVGLAYGKKAAGYPNWTPPPGPSYKGFRQEDIVHDGIVNILDIATAGKNFGKEAEY